MIESRLKVVLAEKNITAQELSRKTGLSVNQISKFANNKVGLTFGSIDKICEVLNITNLNLLLRIKRNNSQQEV